MLDPIADDNLYGGIQGVGLTWARFEATFEATNKQGTTRKRIDRSLSRRDDAAPCVIFTGNTRKDSLFVLSFSQQI